MIFKIYFLINSFDQDKIYEKIKIVTYKLKLKMCQIINIKYKLTTYSYIHMKNFMPNQDLRKRIENYSYGLKDRIGKGFSSVVFKGINQDTKEIVAIKVVDLKQMKDPTSQQLLKSEIAVIKKFNHRNLLRCDNVFLTNNNCYIVTELCNQGDLATHIKNKGKLKQSEALPLIKDIYDGFKQLASRNVIHRDIKPANILLNNGVAKIADFGFAKVQKSPGQKEKYNVGTPLYMSPSTLLNNIYSIKNDIWGLGVMFYQMLHGSTPWESRTEKELIQKMKRNPLVFRVKLSKQLQNLIRGCLDLDESKRFSVNEMGNILSKFFEKQNKAQQTVQVNPKQQPKNQYFLKNDVLIKGNINLGRYLFKLFNRIENLQTSVENQKNIQTYVLNTLELVMKRLTRTAESRKDGERLMLANFEEYSSSNSFKKFFLVIKDYNQKYMKFLSQYDKKRLYNINTNQQLYLKHFENFRKTISKLELTVQKDAKHIIAVDYLISLIQIIELIATKGIQVFCQVSQIETMAEISPTNLSQKQIKQLIYKRTIVCQN